MTNTESFLNFADRTYRCKGVPDACLALQNNYGADVNVVLFCCWMGTTRGEINAETFDDLLKFSHLWADNVVRRLRHARSWMKTEGCPVPDTREGFTNLRERIKLVEIEAEQLQENIMQSIVETIPLVLLSVDEQVRTAMQNLHRYCAIESIKLTPEGVVHVDVVVNAGIEKQVSGTH